MTQAPWGKVPALVDEGDGGSGSMGDCPGGSGAISGVSDGPGDRAGVIVGFFLVIAIISVVIVWTK